MKYLDFPIQNKVLPLFFLEKNLNSTRKNSPTFQKETSEK